MILLDECDVASVHTLVQLPSSRTRTIPNPDSIRPPRLAPLVFMSIAISVPPFFLAIINTPISILHTAVTIISFLMTIPFHIGALQLLHRVSQSHNPLRGFRIPPKAVSVPYLVLLQILWVVSAIAGGAALEGDVNKLRMHCYHNYEEEKGARRCVRRLLVISIISITLAVIEGIAMGVAALIFFKWNTVDGSVTPRANYEAEQASTSMSNPDSSLAPVMAQSTTKLTQPPDTFLILPLKFTSFGLSFVPFMIAVLQITSSSSDSSTQLYLYCIPAITAYVLTSHVHIVSILAWQATSKSKLDSTVPERPNPYTFIPCKTSIIALCFVALIWVVSVVMGIRYLVVHRGQHWWMDIELVVFVVTSVVEVITLCGLLLLACRFFFYEEQEGTDSVDMSRRVHPLKRPVETRVRG